jgi:hypothetical protein
LVAVGHGENEEIRRSNGLDQNLFVTPGTFDGADRLRTDKPRQNVIPANAAEPGGVMGLAFAPTPWFD